MAQHLLLQVIRKGDHLRAVRMRRRGLQLPAVIAWRPVVRGRLVDEGMHHRARFAHGLGDPPAIGAVVRLRVFVIEIGILGHERVGRGERVGRQRKPSERFGADIELHP